jgi:hypothetical protein
MIKNCLQNLIKFMLNFELIQMTNIQQTICYIRKKSDFPVGQIL